MLTALRSNQARRSTASSASMPAPVGGLNARDDLVRMPATDAITLENFFPEANYVALRRGHASHGTGLVADVQTLLTYRAFNGTEKLFAAANNRIYDVTNAGSGSSVYATGITSNKWQTLNFSTTTTHYILAFNGSDAPLIYDGVTWATNGITGVTASNLINACAHKKRIWMIERNTLNLWYLASGAITGAATKFPVSSVPNLGGSLVAVGSLSLNDSGAGIDDLLVAVTSNGEALVYQGTDPATDYALVGLYPIGIPLGSRCLERISGDLIVLTTAGALSMRQMLNFDRAMADKAAVTAKIQESFNSAARAYGANFGWQAFIYPKARYAIFNVPEVAGSRQKQFVQNVITGAWCKFSGLNANCWGTLNNELYFGGNGGIVYKADTGYTDNNGDISATLKTAFSDFRAPAQTKFFTAIRPLMLASGNVDALLGINVDYADVAPSGTLSPATNLSNLWGPGSAWGASVWGGNGLQLNDWQTVGELGSTAAIHLRVASHGASLRVNGFDLLFERGGVF